MWAHSSLVYGVLVELCRRTPFGSKASTLQSSYALFYFRGLHNIVLVWKNSTHYREKHVLWRTASRNARLLFYLVHNKTLDSRTPCRAPATVPQPCATLSRSDTASLTRPCRACQMQRTTDKCGRNRASPHLKAKQLRHKSKKVMTKTTQQIAQMILLSLPSDTPGARFYDMHGTTLQLFVIFFPVQYMGKRFALETREIIN